jgi:hypothetical protein
MDTEGACACRESGLVIVDGQVVVTVYGPEREWLRKVMRAGFPETGDPYLIQPPLATLSPNWRCIRREVASGGFPSLRSSSW